MTDMAPTIVPKSDQLNCDSLIAGPLTIKVTKVSILAGDQPVAVHYEGDEGKPYKPCKSMRRVMVMLWGGDASAFVGRRMTLYRDEDVKFGGDAVGGIRISHMSHIDREAMLALTVTRGKRKPYKVLPLPDEADPELVAAGEAVAAQGVEAYTAWLKTIPAEQKATIRGYHGQWAAIAKKFDAENG